MGTYYRRKLPHIHPPEAVFFVTFRLAGSLPVHVVQQLRAQLRAEERHLRLRTPGDSYPRKRYELQKRFFGRYDDQLDNLQYGPAWLRRPEIATIVQPELHRLNGTQYDLIAYCIMPNHVHLLVNMARFRSTGDAPATSPLSRALRILRGRTARFANQALNRTGKFWQDESYDHVVRDWAELERILRYIVYNPVKARLVEDWQEWPYTFVTEDLTL